MKLLLIHFQLIEFHKNLKFGKYTIITMHEALIQYINAHATTPLTETEADIVKNIFTPRRIRNASIFYRKETSAGIWDLL